MIDPPKCLVLGKNYSPISVFPKLSLISGEEAIRKYLDQKAEVLYFHDRPVLSRNKPILLQQGVLRWPSIIVDYKQKIRDTVRLTRSILYIREDQKCFWCDEPIASVGEATKDHIIPKSKGGMDTFENLVCACRDCNTEKADQMPVGKWALKGRSPRKPTYYELLEKRKNTEIVIFDERWIEFLPNFASYKNLGSTDLKSDIIIPS